MAFLTPIAKAFMTEVGFEAANHGHPGIEPTRDCPGGEDRILKRSQSGLDVLHENPPGGIEGRRAEGQANPRGGQAVFKFPEDERRNLQLVAAENEKLGRQQEDQRKPPSPNRKGEDRPEAGPDALPDEPQHARSSPGQFRCPIG